MAIKYPRTKIGLGIFIFLIVIFLVNRFFFSDINDGTLIDIIPDVPITKDIKSFHINHDDIDCDKKCEYKMAKNCINKDGSWDKKCNGMTDKGYYCHYTGKQFDTCTTAKCGTTSETMGKCTPFHLKDKLKAIQ